MRLLRASPFTESTIDILIEAHCDLVAFAHRAFLALDPSQRLYPSTLHDTMDVISDLIGELQDWTDRRAKIQGERIMLTGCRSVADITDRLQT